MEPVIVIGAGLAGSEAAWQLARRGVSVTLREMKPAKMTPAHHTEWFGELVCSNSLRSDQLENAVGLLKEELRRMDSLILTCADAHRVEAGGALAVDRHGFARAVTEKIRSHPLITVEEGEVTQIPESGNVIVASGPLTSDPLAQAIAQRYPQNGYLHFFDAAAPLVTFESVDMNSAWFASRYDRGTPDYINCPLTEEEYQAFRARHAKAAVPRVPFGADYAAPVHIGIDSGSTTVKMVVIDEQARILFTDYRPNLGNPVPLIREVLQKLYAEHPALHVASVTTTGYGEDLAKAAFHADYGVVETVAHFTAARHFLPNVDFIIDIGGQDMKCFKIRNGAVDSIMLNEACSSGCGSFIETFAKALGYSIADFAKLGLFAQHPVNLGSRCTVFMNSSVKQAQKDGASVEDISAGLSISIVKNAIYKVIRAASADDLGKHIVVQGGTFHNDAVLRAFEQELGRDVTRPTISGIMGAFGAALAARDLHLEKSAILPAKALEKFTHVAKPATCGLCTNHCSLTVNTFDGGKMI